MAEQARHIPTYGLNDTIRIELDVSDESGVGQVRARFHLVSNLSQSIYFETMGSRDKKDEKITLEKEVTEDIAPGDYVCQYVSLIDIRGNQNLISGPDISFRVGYVPGDHEPPQLKGWQVISPEGIPSEGAFNESTVHQKLLQEERALTSNSVQVTTGAILLIRYQGKYGAVQLVEQASYERGEFVRYAWWYQPDGSGVFINDNAQFGFGDTKAEGGPRRIIRVGPIELEWSIASEGSGYVYFGPSSTPSPEYELFPTDLINISSVNAANYAGQFRAGRATT